jgi:hypothetical protein
LLIFRNIIERERGTTTATSAGLKNAHCLSTVDREGSNSAVMNSAADAADDET